MEIVNHASPNFGKRAIGFSVNLLLIHYTGMKTCTQALKRLSDPASGVSSHYLINETGVVYRLVDERYRAWHAGVSLWKGETDINSLSIGIELANPGHENGYQPFPEKQMSALISLCRNIFERYDIPHRRVLGHSDVAPGRKRDPGELFDWKSLADAGIGYWPRGERVASVFNPNAIKVWQAKFKELGYGIQATGKFDLDTKAVVTAFQRHWLPENISGKFDKETSSMLDQKISDCSDIANPE